MKEESCPCGSGLEYIGCCGLYIEGGQTAPTPEALMRSRYTAFTKANIDYIMQTMRSPAADNFNAIEATTWAKQVKWIKLEVLDHNYNEKIGFVEFIAHLVDLNKAEVIHERSEFHLIDEKWYYIDGIVPTQKNVPIRTDKQDRNALCSCGSGKKYKKCCGL